MATDVFGDYEDQERHYDKPEDSRVFGHSALRETTEQVATDFLESRKILIEDEHVDHETAYDLAKMVVEHRMRVMGERY